MKNSQSMKVVPTTEIPPAQKIARRNNEFLNSEVWNEITQRARKMTPGYSLDIPITSDISRHLGSDDAPSVSLKYYINTYFIKKNPGFTVTRRGVDRVIISRVP